MIDREPWYLRKFITLMMFSQVLIQNCSKPTSIPSPYVAEHPVIEIKDMYQAGHREFIAALKTETDLSEQWEKSRSQVVIVTATLEKEDGELEHILQSGFFIEAGSYILSAGHGFFDEEGEVSDIRARTPSGHKLSLELVNALYNDENKRLEDWAILKPVTPYPSEGMVLSPSFRSKGHVLVIGYPGALGLDGSETVVHAREVDRGVVYPLGILCSRRLMEQQLLYAEGGAIPIRGMSGAPVVNKKGEVIGIFSSVSRTRSISGWHYIFGIADIPRKRLELLLSP